MDGTTIDDSTVNWRQFAAYRPIYVARTKTNNIEL